MNINNSMADTIKIVKMLLDSRGFEFIHHATIALLDLTSFDLYKAVALLAKLDNFNVTRIDVDLWPMSEYFVHVFTFSHENYIFILLSQAIINYYNKLRNIFICKNEITKWGEHVIMINNRSILRLLSGYTAKSLSVQRDGEFSYREEFGKQLIS